MDTLKVRICAEYTSGRSIVVLDRTVQLRDAWSGRSRHVRFLIRRHSAFEEVYDERALE